MTQTADARDRVFQIIDEKSFIRRRITLSSGKESDHYFDMKPTMFDPEAAKLLCEMILDRIADLDVDHVGGLEMGAVPLVAPIALVSGLRGRPIPGFFVRKDVKAHGTMKRIEGVEDMTGKRVVVVEDVTTTGGSAMKAVEALRAAGAEVVLVISILDREEGAEALYAEAGLPFASLFKASEFLNRAA